MITLIIVSFIAKKIWPSRSWGELRNEQREETLELIEENERLHGLRA